MGSILSFGHVWRGTGNWEEYRQHRKEHCEWMEAMFYVWNRKFPLFVKRLPQWSHSSSWLLILYNDLQCLSLTSFFTLHWCIPTDPNLQIFSRTSNCWWLHYTEYAAPLPLELMSSRLLGLTKGMVFWWMSELGLMIQEIISQPHNRFAVWPWVRHLIVLWLSFPSVQCMAVLAWIIIQNLDLHCKFFGIR